MAIQILNKSNFNSAIENAEKPVIVDFFADWCGPCKMIAPILEELAKENEGDISFFKVNVDEDPEIATKYLVQNIPTFISFKGGQQHSTMVGAGSKQKILDMVK